METLYQGSCHCGATRFEVSADITHARVCNCSICRKRGTMIFRVPHDALTLLTAWDDLTTYRWGSGTAVDYFCPSCGILPFRRPSAPTKAERAQGVKPFGGWAINLRCLDGVDLEALEVRRIDGAAL